MLDDFLEKVKINYLAEVPQYIEIIAQWEFQQWREYDPSINVQKTVAKLHTRLYTDRVPLVFVASLENSFCGSVGLKEKIKLPGYESRDLWLGSLFVLEKFRHKGLGYKLLLTAQNKAVDLRYKKISLFTTVPEALTWYQKQGWKQFAIDTFNNNPAWLLEYEL